MAVCSIALAAASALAMAALYHSGYDPTRIYDGTDTRAGGLLIGAAAAMLWPSRRLFSKVSRRTGILLDGLGVAGLRLIALLAAATSEYSPFLFRGGLVVLSVATAAVLVVVTLPAGRLGRALGWSPLRWIGVRLDGIYLWHLPVIALTTPTLQRGLSVPTVEEINSAFDDLNGGRLRG
jgi:peptidoglycan/LPS O-acetylase OafA/YrhL